MRRITRRQSVELLAGRQGNSATCTITNSDTPVVSLTVIKNVARGNLPPDAFSLTVNGNLVLSGIPNSYPINSTIVLGESQQEGYVFMGITGDGCPSNLGEQFTLTQDTICTITNKSQWATDDHWDTRPTFGISHEDRSTQLVTGGFQFNDMALTITDNHHTHMPKQKIVTGTVNSFAATVYADKKLKIQEFLFGVPEVGMGQEWEFEVEAHYDTNGDFDEVFVYENKNGKNYENTEIIDKNSMSITHEKVKCAPTDEDKKCDKTIFSAIFLEPLKNNVIAIKAIDFDTQVQTTYLNEGFDISGNNFNPLPVKMIPSNIKNEGLIKITQIEKYSDYWISGDGRIFEMNSFGSFKQINQSFERFKDTGNPYTRQHSEFGKIIAYEQKRATQMFNSTDYQSNLPDIFFYEFPEHVERIDENMKQEMSIQEQIAKNYLEKTYVQSRW